MKVLVTGNLGYIGPVLGKFAKDTIPDIDLTGIDSGLFQADYSTRGKVGDCYYDRQVFKDVRVLKDEDFSGVDAVIALAAISNDPMGQAFSAATYQVNRDAVIANAQSAKRMGVKKFVFASSCSVYGAGGDKAKEESDDVNPLTDYAKSKIECEAGLKEIADENFQVICLRFATACGASNRTRLDLVLNDFVWTFLTTDKINILSDGTPLRPIIDVQDMSRAMCWAAQYNSLSNFLVLNCGNDVNNFSVLELAMKVTFGDLGKISINADAVADLRSYRVNFSKFEKLSGFYSPINTVEESIRQLTNQFSVILPSMKIYDECMEQFKRHSTLNRLIKDGSLNKDLKWSN